MLVLQTGAVAVMNEVSVFGEDMLITRIKVLPMLDRRLVEFRPSRELILNVSDVYIQARGRVADSFLRSGCRGQRRLFDHFVYRC
jgi:hypothetical protein